jgi:RNA polymerase sigma-70 factor, ECF subfamily
MSRRAWEQPLIEAAKNGSDSAFEELFLIYKERIYRIAYSITGNREDAEDAMQDAFLRAYACLTQFRCEASFYSWLVRIVMNSSVMLLRKLRRRRELSMEGIGNSEYESAGFDFPDPRRNPEQICTHRQEYRRVMHSIEKLPSQLRAVAELRMIHDLSLNDAEQILGISKAALKSRLFRVRKSLVSDRAERMRLQVAKAQA